MLARGIQSFANWQSEPRRCGGGWLQRALRIKKDAMLTKAQIMAASLQEQWSDGLGQLNATFKWRLLVHAAALCLGRKPQ